MVETETTSLLHLCPKHRMKLAYVLRGGAACSSRKRLLSTDTGEEVGADRRGILRDAAGIEGKHRMAITDANLIEALKLLTPAERAAFVDPMRATTWADTEAQLRLLSIARRKLKSALKRRARSRKERRNNFKWLN